MIQNENGSPEPEPDAAVALVRRLFEAVINQCDLDTGEELVAADVVDHNPGPSDSPGRDGLRQVFELLHQAFPDLHGRIDDIFCDGDRVVVRWTVGGTNTQRCMGIGPTGRRILGTGIDILRVEDGRVVERWGNSDDMRMLAQMGLLEEVLSCPTFNPHSSEQFSPLVGAPANEASLQGAPDGG